MSTFSFTIPAADVNTIKNTTGSSDTQITVDRGMTRAVTHNVQIAKFGDGYSQRVRHGLNSKGDSFNISLNNRKAEDIALVAGFLDLKAALSFDLVITDDFGTGANAEKLVTSTVKVMCDTYNISFTQPTIHSLTAVFNRVYEP